jgi:hypothetical protein
VVNMLSERTEWVLFDAAGPSRAEPHWVRNRTVGISVSQSPLMPR